MLVLPHLLGLLQHLRLPNLQQLLQRLHAELLRLLGCVLRPFVVQLLRQLQPSSKELSMDSLCRRAFLQEMPDLQTETQAN